MIRKTATLTVLMLFLLLLTSCGTAIRGTDRPNEIMIHRFANRTNVYLPDGDSDTGDSYLSDDDLAMEGGINFVPEELESFWGC